MTTVATQVNPERESSVDRVQQFTNRLSQLDHSGPVVKQEANRENLLSKLAKNRAAGFGEGIEQGAEKIAKTANRVSRVISWFDWLMDAHSSSHSNYGFSNRRDIIKQNQALERQLRAFQQQMGPENTAGMKQAEAAGLQAQASDLQAFQEQMGSENIAGMKQAEAAGLQASANDETITDIPKIMEAYRKYQQAMGQEMQEPALEFDPSASKQPVKEERNEREYGEMVR